MSGRTWIKHELVFINVLIAGAQFAEVLWRGCGGPEEYFLFSRAISVLYV